MSNGAEVVADALMDSLLVGETFTVPTVNLNDPAFNFPSIVGNPLYNAVSELTNEDLTTRIVGGTGTYDAIMASQAVHLKDEFTAGRITGAEYTKAYIALAQAACGQAIQFLLGKDQAYWASVLAQGQALAAKVQLETAKVQLAIALVEMNNQRALFALNKIRLANEDAQYGITQYNLGTMLPAQLGQLTAQTANVTAEGLNIPKQGTVLINQAAQIAQQTTNLVSEELSIDARTALSTQQKTNLVAEALNIPKQGTLLDAQKSGVDKANLISDYNLASLLPAQLILVKEQAEVQRAQTLDARADGNAVAGSVKSQKDLYAQQVISYQRSSQTNAAKVWVDSWVADSALQDSPTVPAGFSSANIGSVLTTLKSVNNL